jgi:cytochrome c553
LGIVPVEDDGSAYFVVPADRNIFFQALDSEYREIQRERTYINFRPGEFRSCIGCHERSGEAPTPPFGSGETPMALQNDPCIPAPMPGEPAGTGDWAGWGVKVLHYPYDIQPIFDSACVSCHFDGGQDPDLTGGITEYYTVSFESLADGEYCGPLVNENNDYMSDDWTEYKSPKFFGCYSSALADKLYNDPDHRARVTDLQLRTIFRWVDTNYSFYGTYYGRHHSDHSSDPDFRRMPTVEEALSNVAPSWHN